MNPEVKLGSNRYSKSGKITAKAASPVSQAVPGPQENNGTHPPRVSSAECAMLSVIGWYNGVISPISQMRKPKLRSHKQLG